MECGSCSWRSDETEEEDERDREQHPEAGAVEGEWVALEKRHALAKERLDLVRVREVERHLAVVLVAPRGIDAERASNNGIEPRRDVGIERAGGPGGVEDRGLEPLDLAKGHLARDRLEKHDADRKKLRALGHRLAVKALGCQVAGRAGAGGDAK